MTGDGLERFCNLNKILVHQRAIRIGLGKRGRIQTSADVREGPARLFVVRACGKNQLFDLVVV